MAIILTKVPYNAYVDTSTGEPLSFGFLFFGIADQDPEQNPIQVQVRNQGGMLVDIDQPIRTNSAGIPIYNKNPTQLFIDGDYSMRVKNQYGFAIFTSPNSNDANANALQADNNLSDLSDVVTAVENLGLTGTLLAANNLDDLANVITARTNLGIQNLFTNALISQNNLDDVADVATARTNLGITDGFTITNSATGTAVSFGNGTDTVIFQYGSGTATNVSQPSITLPVEFPTGCKFANGTPSGTAYVNSGDKRDELYVTSCTTTTLNLRLEFETLNVGTSIDYFWLVIGD